MVIFDAWNIRLRVIDNSAYKLNLPPSMSSIFSIFHSWLHLDKSDFLPGQIVSPLPLIWFDKYISLGEYFAG